MSDLLRPGQIVQTESGSTCEVGRFLGSGTQGEVYACKWGSSAFALKWYFPQQATESQRKSLAALIKAGSPTAHFLWPEDLAHAKGVAGFGYVMRLREPKYRGLNELVGGRLEIGALALINATIELTKAIRELHTRGLCYRDISFGNAFLEPDEGQILVCDNDNVTVNRTPWSDIGGTMGFMAPEVVRGEVPSRTTDAHSLAVLLFHMLLIGHPLMGKKMLTIRSWDSVAQQELFGKKPVFIFDPDDRSNEALDKAYDPTGEAGGTAIAYWRIYPQFLRDAFTKAFTVGLHDPSRRPTDLEWLNTLARMRDSMYRCRCGTPNYYDPVVANGALLPPTPCWACGATPNLPFRIRIDKKVVMLNFDSKLHPHHVLGEDAAFDYSRTLAEVTRHPTDPNLWGLKNLGSAKWVATLPDGSLRDVEPGRSVPLATGTRIGFGRAEGVIKY